MSLITHIFLYTYTKRIQGLWMSQTDLNNIHGCMNHMNISCIIYSRLLLTIFI